MAKKNPPPETIGERVRSLRAKESQKAFADRAGLPVATLRNLEQGRTDVTLSTLTKIAVAFNITVADLLFNVKDGVALPRRRGRPKANPA